MSKAALNRSAQDPVAETGDTDEPIGLLRRVAERMAAMKGEIPLFGQRLAQALSRGDWNVAERTLQAFVDSADELAAAQARSSGPVETAQWQQAASRLLAEGLAPLFPEADPLADAARNALARSRMAFGAGDAAECASSLDALLARCGGYGAAQGRRQALTLELLRHLLGNMAALAEQESWVQGQIANAELLLSGALAEESLASAIANLKEVAARQAELKANRDAARDASERMSAEVVAHLDAALDSAQQYGGRMEGYASRLGAAPGPEDFAALLDEARGDTVAQGERTLRLRQKVVEAQDALQDAKRRIAQLESKLEEMSELAREDPLTHSMNRRGMMEALCREMRRSRRHGSPLSIAMIDIDNFKQLNDRLGHSAGDGALVHLVGIIRNTLRQMDVIARFGGEEFLLLLPSTGLDDAVAAVSRIQRELTKSIFLYEHQRVLVTFSAGAALVGEEDSEDSLIRRADAALYQAKRQGKNRVVAAQ
jgi:diguanylate cyclase